MSLRPFTLLCTFALTVSASFGQRGIYGPVTAHPKAGDPAPDIVFQQALNSAGPATWTSANFSGQVTVLGFFPDTTDNLQAASEWNARIAEFAAKSVQFVWITAEDPSALLPWLKEHPLKQWVLVDSTGTTGRAYGEEVPSTLIIGPDRRIIGFDVAMVPEARTLEAALEGRITTTPPDAAELQSFAASGLVLLHSEAMRIPGPNDENRPNFPASFDLHVSPSQVVGHGDFGSEDYRSLQGFDIKSALSTLYEGSAARIDFPRSLDSKNYDFSMVLPEREDQEKISERMREGILNYFGLVANEVTRVMDVYVVTAPGGSILRRSDEVGDVTSVRMASIERESTEPEPGLGQGSPSHSLAQIGAFSAEGTLDDICRVLESQADQPVVNETNLEGEFQVDVVRTGSSASDFFDRIRSQAGLIITPAKRNVTILVIGFR